MNNEERFLRLMKTRVEFIKQKLTSSNKKEFLDTELIVNDLSDVISKLNSFGMVNDMPIQIESLPWKFFGHLIFKKEDLLYRLEKALAILDSLLISV